MKQIMSVAGGVFCTISIISLIFGGASLSGMINLQNELKGRGKFDVVLGELIGTEKENEQKLKNKQNEVMLFFVLAGVTGSLGIGMILAGKNKPNTV
ncbi:hypothetical protein [Nostoc sp. UHCC 0870]|uniref:hypothetical protein n=1 Tax=Nostoc sp. UHCC 0870 TaxID=2914041 RepID=UPI001EE12788|nr:hypothetical protein [Nostoc sp. UHCC 0870]UKO96356.1 hypothetical protein L6494_17160 [Nostoc sp. UHCC 0870]